MSCQQNYRISRRTTPLIQTDTDWWLAFLNAGLLVPVRSDKLYAKSHPSGIHIIITSNAFMRPSLCFFFFYKIFLCVYAISGGTHFIIIFIFILLFIVCPMTDTRRLIIIIIYIVALVRQGSFGVWVPGDERTRLLLPDCCC